MTQYEQWFESNPQYVERMLERANLYLYQIVQEVQKRHMPMEIALLPAIESAYSPNADSSAGAIGLWQIEPSTGGLWGLKDNWWYSGARDVIASTNAALDYLQALHNQFHSWNLALAAYNCGAGTVQWAINNNKAQGLGTHYQELRLPLQTEHYVPKLMAFVNIVRDPAKFGLRLRDIPNSPYFVRVNTGGQIGLNVVARLANMSLHQLAAINPGFKHWATAPNGPYTVLVPVATKAALLEGLSQLPPQDRMQWARHIVVPGNTISGIAQEYGVSVRAIMTTNHLYGSFLRVGQRLLIPVAGRRLVVATQGGEYTVTPGDTLSGIAQQYGVPVGTLMAVNNLNSPYLQVGEVLRIP
ncbi:MAG: LysM peptidoglycan-binding domain-containing protein, partial [Acidiferrobacter sp.]